MKSTSRYHLILLTGVLFFGFALQAQAMSTNKLNQLIAQNGIDYGVKAALTAGMNVDEILITSMTFENLNPRTILIALCRAGANAIDMREAAMTQDVSPLIFANAMDTCNSQLEEDAQAYTAAQKKPGKKIDPIDPIPEPYASVSTF